MKKSISIHPKAQKELNKFDQRVRLDFDSLIKILEVRGQLTLPDGKKIGRKLFEIRVRVGGIYRGIYAYVGAEGIIVLHFFQKKSQKTPIKSIKIAERRYKEYE